MSPTELWKTYETESLDPPFPYMPKAEWESRIKRAQNLMKDKGLDGLLILNNHDMIYFFGRGKRWDWGFPWLGIIPREGPTAVVADAAYADIIAAEGYVNRNIGYRGEIGSTRSAKAADPIKLMIEVMRDLDLTNKKIGLERGQGLWWEGFNMSEWEEFKEGLPEVKFVDATDLIWEMRTIKSPWELSVQKKLFQATIKGYRYILDNAGPGKNEQDLFYGALKIWMDERIIGSMRYMLSVINAGAYFGPSAPELKRGRYVIGLDFKDRALEKGDYFMVDGGPHYKGYIADMQRMVHIGEPGEEIRRAGRLAVRAHEAVEKIMKPGTTTGEMYMTGYNEVAKEQPSILYRMGASRKGIGHAGHGIGLSGHEPPYVCQGSDIKLKEGMTVTIEFGVGVEDKRIANFPEDVYLITKDGFENLTKDLGPIDIIVKT